MSEMMRNSLILACGGTFKVKVYSNLFSIENYLHQQKDSSCSASDKLLCIRKKEGKNNSGIFSHIENLTHVKQNDTEDKQVGIAPYMTVDYEKKTKHTSN